MLEPRNSYSALDTSAYAPYRSRGLSLSLGASLAGHGLLVGALVLSGLVVSSPDRTLQLSATTSTSRSVDVTLKRPRPVKLKKAEETTKQKPAEGTNVKQVSRFNSDVLQKHTRSIYNSIVYPRMARRMGWQGRVKIQAVVAPDGSVQSARVLESSGYGILDQSALSGVLQHRFTPGSDTETIVIALRFKLKSQN